MSTELTHPDIDPLNLRGKRIGMHHDDRFRYTIESFSYPATIEVFDKDYGEKVMKVGFVCLYRVKFNFQNAGRKMVTYKVNNFEVEGTPHHVDSQKKRVISFLENNAETVLANNIDDILLDWETITPNDKKSD